MDITVRHPLYDAFRDAWRLMRDAFDGEDAIKQAGELYLPTKTGIERLAETDPPRAKKAYDAYRGRAEFPDLVALTVRGAVGTMLDSPAAISLPAALEPLRERATRDGLTLDALHRRIATELMLTGRYGILPGIADGVPYLSGYVAESIINWDASDGVTTDFVVLDETGKVRNKITGAWEEREQFRECSAEGGRYGAKVWTKLGGEFVAGEATEGTDPRGAALKFLPFVFVNVNDLTSAPDDVPLYGLAKLAVRIYRMDADLTTSLHMTAEPTPVVSGYDDPKAAIKDGQVPQGIGASTLWVLPKDGKAEFLEFNGPGIEKQLDVIQRNYDRAVMFGAQLLSDKGAVQESGEAKKVRLDSQHATLKTIAMTSAAGLERALKNVAVWVGADPDEVEVKPNLDFFDHTLSAQEITAVVQGWMNGAYSWEAAFQRLQKGGVIDPEVTAEEELARIGKEDERNAEDERAALPPPREIPAQ
jgi:hypothetical protein